MCDEIFAHDVTEGVFHLCFLNEEVVFGIETFANLGALEIEGEPFLDAVEVGALSEVHEECEVECDRGGEDGVTAEEIDFDLHGVSEPTEDIDVIPAFFGIATGGIIFDTDFVIVIAVEFGECFCIEDVFCDGEFGDFFCLERTGIIEDFAVAVAENVGGIPAVQAEAASAEARAEDGFHEGLTGFEVFTGDGNFIFECEFNDGGAIDGEVRRAIDVRDVALKCSVGVDHGRGDARIVIFESFFESFDGFVDVFNRGVDFSGTAPKDDGTIAAVIFDEVFDIVHKCQGEIILCGSSFLMFHFEIFAIFMHEYGVHRFDGFEFFADRIEVFVIEDFGAFADFVCIFAVNVPSAKDDIFEFGKGDEILNNGVSVVGTFAEANASHLSDGADGEAVSGDDVINASDHGGGDSTETGNEDSQFSICRFYVYTISHFYMPLREMRVTIDASKSYHSKMGLIDMIQPPLNDVFMPRLKARFMP